MNIMKLQFLPIFYRHHSSNTQFQNIPYLLDYKDLGPRSQNKQRHVSTLVDNGANAKVAKILRAESLRYVYLVKKMAIGRLGSEVLKKAKNLDEADYLISQKLKNIAPLMLLTSETFGELVNYQVVKHQYQIDYKSIHRILENFHLWTNRYIQSEVIQYYDFIISTYITSTK